MKKIIYLALALAFSFHSMADNKLVVEGRTWWYRSARRTTGDHQEFGIRIGEKTNIDGLDWNRVIMSMYTVVNMYDTEAASAKTDTTTIAFIREVDGNIITKASEAGPYGFKTIIPLYFYLQGSLFGVSDPFYLYRFGKEGEKGFFGFKEEHGDYFTIQSIEPLSNSGIEYKKYSCSVSKPVEMLYCNGTYEYIEGIGSPSDFLLLPCGGGDSGAFGWDCPQLTYVTEGSENQVIFEAKGGPKIWKLSGVESVISDIQPLAPQWFTLQGVRIGEPTRPGLYIRQTGKTTEKVVVK